MNDTDLEAERLARVALARTREPGDPWLGRAVAELGAVELYDHLRSGRRHRDTAETVAGKLVGVDPERELDRARRVGLRFVVPGDDEWPGQLDDLVHVEPLNDQGGAPLGLWVRGPGRLDRLQRSVAIVGSRSATTYGTDVAAEIAAGCAAAGWAVVSGGAVGIDVSAHRGALAGAGLTAAVLACGADRVYPLAHEELLELLAAEHLLVSETIPAGAPLKHRFLSRNRVIVALARGTVIVEAAARSGALNSSSWATRLNRTVMGVPGPTTSASSEGVHGLIRTGRATLVTCAADVLDLVGEAGEHLAPEPRGPDRPHDRLAPPTQLVLEAVPAVRAAPTESIARVAGIPAGDASAALTELAGAGLVVAVGTGWRLARQPREGVHPT